MNQGPYRNPLRFVIPRPSYVGGHNQRGLSLIELIIIMIILFIICAICLGSTTNKFGLWSNRIRRHAQLQAQGYIAQHHADWGATVCTCQGQDNDGNGYVRCDCSAQMNSSAQRTSIECESYVWWSTNPGCQIPLPGSGVRYIRNR